MNESCIYTRAYRGSSPRQLVSGKGSQKAPLSSGELLDEFRNHADRFQTTTTALVSVSGRIVDTVKRAYDLVYREGALPDDTWVVFIEVPRTTQGPPPRVHSAKYLAESCGLSEPTRFSHEYLFEGEIPEKYVSHRVSLKTLVNRGLDRKRYYLGETVSTADLRRSIADSFNGSNDWETGLSLGFFAKLFGARAPLGWIVQQLYLDCLRRKDGGYVDFTLPRDMDDGVDTALIDWWLTGETFNSDYQWFKWWEACQEEIIARELEDFCEAWNEAGRACSNVDELATRVSWEKGSAFIQAKEALEMEHAELRREIEVEAVRIGL